MSSLLLELLALELGHMGEVVTDLGKLLFELLGVVPFLHFVEHESLSLLDGILSINSSDHLHRICGGHIVEIKDSKSASERLTWLEIMTESDVWVSLHSLKDIVGGRVVLIDLLESKIVVDGILLVLPVSVETVAAADDDVDGDLRIVIDLLSASVDSRDKVGVPDGTTIHEDVIAPVVVREDGWDEGRSQESSGVFLSWKSLIENDVSS